MLSEQAIRKMDESRIEYVKIQGDFVSIKDEEARRRHVENQFRNVWNRSFEIGYETATQEMQVLETRITILRKALEYYAHGAPRAYVEKAQIKGGIVFLGKEFEARAIEALFVDDKLAVKYEGGGDE